MTVTVYALIVFLLTRMQTVWDVKHFWTYVRYKYGIIIIIIIPVYYYYSILDQLGQEY